jgi:hypothetical protein
MDYEFERSWALLESSLKERFEEVPDLHTITMLIGLQETGFDFRDFSKDEKLVLMHIGICTVLAPFGFYRFTGRDKEGWPMYERTEALPALSGDEQQRLLKKAILGYFNEN